MALVVNLELVQVSSQLKYKQYIKHYCYFKQKENYVNCKDLILIEYTGTRNKKISPNSCISWVKPRLAYPLLFRKNLTDAAKYFLSANYITL